MIRLVWHLTGILVFGMSTLVSGEVRGSFERTLHVTGPLQLEVSTGSGSITVRSGGEGTVEVEAEIRAPSSWADEVRRLEADPPIERDGNLIRIGLTDDRELRRHLKISYEIVVPVETSLVSSTGSGSQSIDDLAGPLEVATGSGSLDIGRIGADVDARTGSGSITVDGVGGELAIKSGSGSIRAENVTGAISARSGSGSVHLEQTGSGDVEVQSGSGRVEVAGVRGGLSVRTGSGSIDAQGEMAGAWYLHASSGTITVELPEDASFELDAETSSGSIDSRHPVTVSGISTREKRLRGSVRGGGPRLSLHTSSGSIRIR